jgi:hypothetical protein
MSTTQSSIPQQGQQGQPGYHQNVNDEIDLIDLLRTLWDLKFYAVGGLVAGICIAVAIVPFAVKTKYTAKINVNLDITSFPAISVPDELVKKLNEQLGTERADRILSAEVLREFPELSKMSQDGEPIFSGRTATSAKDLPVLIENSSGTNRFLVGITLGARPTAEGNLRLALTQGLNEIVRLANLDAEQVYLAQGKSALQNASLANEKSQDLVEKSRNDERSLAPIAAEIQIEEFKLQSVAQSLNPSAREFLRQSVRVKGGDEFRDEKKSYEMTVDAIMYLQSNERLTRAFAIVAMLSSEKARSPEEIASRRAELSRLQSELEAAYTRRVTYQRMADASAAAYSDALRSSSQPVDPARVFLPSFLSAPVGPETASDGANAATEQSEAKQEPTQLQRSQIEKVSFAAKPSRSTTIAVSAILCSILGLMLGFGIRVLPQAFRSRRLNAQQQAGVPENQ